MYHILIGSYTKEKSEGIYSIELNTKTQNLENLQLVAKAQNPTYLDYDHDTNTLYSVYQEDKQGGVAIWNMSKTLAVLDRVFTETGSAPCYVKFDQQSQLIYSANYHKGKINIYSKNGLDRSIDYGPGAKAHYINTDPKTQDLFTCDLGLDAVHKYNKTKELTTFYTEKGKGPRHIAFHPTLNILYVFTELSSEIIVLEDLVDQLRDLQTITTLPEGVAVKSGAAIRISKDGRFLYASNRGHDSISIFSIQKDGKIQWVDNTTVYGAHPRDFNLSPDDRYLVVANKDTNNLTLFSRDKDTGKLMLLQSDIKAFEPTSILFI